jgi:hypothetical protein
MAPPANWIETALQASGGPLSDEERALADSILQTGGRLENPPPDG